SRRWLSALAVLLLAADLWHYGHRLPRTVPAAVYQVPPPLAASLLPARDRVFAPPQAGPDLTPAKVANQDDRASLYIARLTPYGGLLWRIPYAFDLDFDLMLTNWAQSADEILQHEWPEPARSFRYLGVWNVRTILIARRVADQPPAGSDPVLVGLSRLENSHVLPRFRFVPRATFHPSLTAAIAAARAANWASGREEHAVRTGMPAQTLVYAQPPRLLDSADEGKRVRLHYRADGGAFFVAATTFDEGWRAQVDGAPVAVYPTAACQIGVELPPGEHRLVLEYRDPFVPVGAAVSLFALLVGALIFTKIGTGRRPQEAP
ncbi:MAG: YfhO family protein, partial [Thermoanaerobaculia bacterium]